MNLTLIMVCIAAAIFIIASSVFGLWAIFKFGKNYKYERDDPLATLPKGIGLLELISPKCKKGIFNTDNEDSSEKKKK